MLWETLPLIWLIVLCIYDFKKDFTLKTFFCIVADEIYRRKEEIRGKDTHWECPLLKVSLDRCPVFFTLNKYKRDFLKRCPKVFKEVQPEAKKKTFTTDKLVSKTQNKETDIFWTIVEKGFLRNNQATYFEIIFIQFFIVGLTANLESIRYIGFFIAVVIFLFPYLLFTFIDQEPLKFFENKRKRLFLVIFTWFFVAGLSLISSPLI